jgi:hypothetical protein
MLDSCTLALMPDVGALLPGDSWVPLSEWEPYLDPNVAPLMNNECEAAGVAFSDDFQGLFFLDGRNKLVTRLLVGSDNLLAWQWTAALASNASIFDLDVSMLPLPSISNPNPSLYVPLRYSLLGADGLAWVVDQQSGTSTQLVPVPPGCSQPDDFGSALIADKFGEGVVQLSDDSCGAVALETSSPWSVLMQVLKAPPAAFNNGVHSHPVFESATSNL